MSRLLIHQASQSSANPPGLAIPGTTAFTGEAGQLPQTGPGSRQRLGTAGAAPRRCHCLGRRHRFSAASFARARLAS